MVKCFVENNQTKLLTSYNNKKQFLQTIVDLQTFFCFFKNFFFNFIYFPFFCFLQMNVSVLAKDTKFIPFVAFNIFFMFYWNFSFEK